MNRALWPLLAGFTLWSVAFVALYALQALGCLGHWDKAIHRLVLVGCYAAFLLGLAATLIWQRRTAGDDIIARIGIWATIAALAATAVIFAPTLFVTLCV